VSSNRERLTGDLGRVTLTRSGRGDLRAFSSAFEVAGHPLTHLAHPILSLALDREHGEDAGFVCLTQARVALASLAYHEEFVERLEGVEQPFWSALRSALIEVAGARN
jgi:hypothetical protein